MTGLCPRIDLSVAVVAESEAAELVTCLWLVRSRYGKRYETAEEMKLRFTIFSENLKLIRSMNKKGLSYTLAVNRESHSPFIK